VGTNADRTEDFGPTLEKPAAGPAHAEGTRPGHLVRVEPCGGCNAAEGGRVDVFKTPFDVKKNSRDFPFVHREGPDFMCQGSAGILHGQTWQGAVLVRIEMAPQSGHAGEATVHHPFEYFRERLGPNTNPQGGWRMVASVAQLVADNTVCFLNRGPVEPVRTQRAEKVQDKVQSHIPDALLDRVGGDVCARG